MEGAIRYLQPASQVLMAMGDTLGATTGAEMIGYALQLQGNRTAAQDQYEQALALIGHRHPQKRLDLLVQLSALHVEMNDANAALADLDEASVLVANGSAIDARDDLGAVKGEALTLQGKCQEALGLLFKSLERSKDRADRRDMKAYVLARIAAAQSCAGDHDLAYSSALEGLALADRCGYVKEQMDNLKALVAACEGKGDVDKAFAFSKRYHALGDSLADARTASAVTGALLTAEFRSAQVADSLTNVLVQRGSEAALSRSKAQRNILLIASLLVLIIAGLLLNRYRLKRRLHEERLRARLARDLHDDIGSTLSSISILSSVAQKRATAGDDGDAANALEKISDRSQRLMRDMSDIVWSVDPTKDAMSDLLIRMREFGTTILEPKGIAFNFVVPAHLPLTLPVEVKNNLYLIFKEAVNNAAKHARATTVDARLSWEKPILRLEVSDNGTGLGPASDESGHGGNGLRNMRERALEMKAELQVISHAGTGTRITLELQRRG
ncbi:MAG: ATP-binding protein [Flavobacteriales bacterium]